MIDVLDGELDGVSIDQEMPAKRRKVRKGTRSCWECKRRKIRCIFASSHDAVCLGCQRRRSTCVSQDMPEELSPARKGNRYLAERIKRVEDCMKDFLASKHVDGISHTEEEARRDSRLNPDTATARPDDSESSTIRSLGDPVLNSSPLTPKSQDVSDQAETETVLRHLFAAFPSQEDTKILLKESSRTSRYNDLINTQSHSKLTPETLAASYPEAELPRRNAHPVILARCMLTLAITLQIPSKDKFLGLSEPQNTIMRRLVTAARTWVTTKEEMQGTVESLICTILEAVFETNCGNLRRAWAVYRRAITAAQLMGLHRSPIPALKHIDREIDAKPEIMWFRIVYMDRYLSLLLGLPQGTSDKSMGAMSVWQNEPPLGRFERLLTVIASRILERNERDFAPSELMTTQSIDAELLKVSKSMPASFWRPANFQGLTAGEPDAFLETLRLGAQVYYYSLLIQLHLPYMMLISNNIEHEYSKITCVNAGREILMRFIAHRTFNPVSSCSRPVDFFALLAAMTLLLAHLNTHYHREASNFLAHQRLSDRAMLDQVLEIMEVMSNVNEDVISTSSAKLVRRLLAMETDAAEGSNYIARSVRGDDSVQEDNEDNEEGEELRLRIPYLGVVKITRQAPISRESPQGNATSRPYQPSQAELLPPIDEQPLSHLNDMAEGSTISGNMLASERSNAQLQASLYEQSMLQYPSSNHDNIVLQPPVGPPPVAAGVDDWVFQGVDMAFFDSLMRGTTRVDDFGIEQ
ncbi:hypothetical protein NA57DRAFT_37775 [Rhizodiscina lignyota]|uniref:Zn(2)-C6 fungal-type domain-containing protein n=1 Tax=Rhizodiscina lignyota TaxID=1504668 RepID=A0A9P4M9E5_9PEZI|nr:hypothetical protein NA57DRAFT_37775 [Rhizodiscina lignyota]